MAGGRDGVEDGGRDGGVVTVAVVDNRAEAALAVGLLESAGLWAFASTDDAGGQEPQWQLGAVRVVVGAPDEEFARQVLADAARHAADPAEDAGVRP
jgi:hypothetical protein